MVADIVMNGIRSARRGTIILLLVCAVTTGVWSEAIAPPPVPSSIVSGEPWSRGFLDRVAGWLVLRKYFPDLESYEEDGDVTGGSQGFHSWTYEVGTFLSLFYSGPLSFDVRGRLMFQSSVSPHGHWSFLASAFLSDLNPSLRYVTGVGTPFAYFRHSCKHDLDGKRRLVMHQGFGGGYESPALDFFGESGPLRNTIFTLQAERNIPAIFPDQPIEPNRWGVHADLRSDLVTPFEWLKVFALGRFALLGNERDDQQWVDTDYQLMFGVKFIHDGGAYTIYLENERLSDNWIVDDPNPSYLWSLGLMFLAN